MLDPGVQNNRLSVIVYVTRQTGPSINSGTICYRSTYNRVIRHHPWHLSGNNTVPIATGLGRDVYLTGTTDLDSWEGYGGTYWTIVDVVDDVVTYSYDNDETKAYADLTPTISGSYTLTGIEKDHFGSGQEAVMAGFYNNQQPACRYYEMVIEAIDPVVLATRPPVIPPPDTTDVVYSLQINNETPGADFSTLVPQINTTGNPLFRIKSTAGVVAADTTTPWVVNADGDGLRWPNVNASTGLVVDPGVENYRVAALLTIARGAGWHENPGICIRSSTTGMILNSLLHNNLDHVAPTRWIFPAHHGGVVEYVDGNIIPVLPSWTQNYRSWWVFDVVGDVITVSVDPDPEHTFGNFDLTLYGTQTMTGSVATDFGTGSGSRAAGFGGYDCGSYYHQLWIKAL
jgi:hypothetical protein